MTTLFLSALNFLGSQAESWILPPREVSSHCEVRNKEY